MLTGCCCCVLGRDEGVWLLVWAFPPLVLLGCIPYDVPHHWEPVQTSQALLLLKAVYSLSLVLRYTTRSVYTHTLYMCVLARHFAAWFVVPPCCWRQEELTGCYFWSTLMCTQQHDGFAQRFCRKHAPRCDEECNQLWRGHLYHVQSVRVHLALMWN